MSNLGRQQTLRKHYSAENAALQRVSAFGKAAIQPRSDSFPHQTVGSILAFSRNRFPGSYCPLIPESRVYVGP